MAAGFRSLFAFWLGGASAGHQTGGKTQETGGGGGAAPGAQHHYRQTLDRRQRAEIAEAARKRAAEHALRQAEELAAAAPIQPTAERSSQPTQSAAAVDETRSTTATRFEAPASAAAPDLVQLVIEQLDAARQERVAREQAAADKERSNRNRIAILTALLIAKN